MKPIIRLLAVFCLFCILFVTSCVKRPVMPIPEETDSETQQSVETTTAKPEHTTSEPTPPPEPKDTDYTLTESDVESFRTLLARSETMIVTDRSTDNEAIEAVLDELEDQFYHIATQSQLAYLHYCLDESDEKLSDAYLYASGIFSDLYAEYMASCLRIDQSDAPYRDTFFSDWTDEDLAEMRGFSDEQTQLSKANDELLVAFRDLSEADFRLRTPELYLQFVGNNQRIAELNGYTNYAAYAYEKVYNRTYTPAEADAIHTNVKTYLVPICKSVLDNFQNYYEKLNDMDKRMVIALFANEYGSAWNAMRGYINEYPEETRDRMMTMFDEENYFYTSSSTAHAGAFTLYLHELERPVVFFGPGYHNAYTLIHEMGHYHAMLISENDEIQMDLAETQSQSNEWLFTQYLVRKQSENLAKAVFYYQLYSSLATIVLGSIIDEFEESVYLNLPTSADEFDSRMTTICEGYGGVEALSSLFTDPQNYWRAVTMESPCYYISYAFSMLVSVEFYSIAAENPETARQTYLTLAGGEMGEMTYPQWLTSMGLKTPFEESLYQTIAGLVE